MACPITNLIDRPPIIVLQDIPQSMDIFLNGKKYQYALVGCVLHQYPSDLECLGHFTAAVKRVHGTWELYNDLLPDKTHSVPNDSAIDLVCYIRTEMQLPPNEISIDADSTLARAIVEDLENAVMQ